MTNPASGLTAAFALTGLLAAGAPDEPLRFVDDLGGPIPGLEVCFWTGPDRECRRPEPGAPLTWPPGATALRAEGPGHGPVWIDRTGPAEPPAGGVVVVPRKAELTLAGVPAGAALDFYRADDPVFRVPLERLRVLDPDRPLLVPAGPMVLAIGSPGRAPDLHRLDALPGGAAAVRHAPRAGWSAILRTTDVHRRRPLPGTWVRLLESTPTAPAFGRRILATVRADDAGLTLLSGIEAPITVAEAVHPEQAPRVVHGLIAPPGRLLYQELGLRPGGTVLARVRWRGEPAPDVPCELLAATAEPAPGSVPSWSAHRARTDSSGRCTLEHVPEGRYFLRLSPPGAPGHADLPAEVADRRVTEVTIDLRPRTIRGTVTRGGAPAADYRLQAGATWPGSAGYETARRASGPQGAAVTDERGEYELSVLAEGSYVLALHSPQGTGVDVRSVTVTDRGTVHDFRVEAEAVTGRVVSARGGPIAGAEVSLGWPRPSGTVVRHRTTSRADGSFELPVPRPGRGRVTATEDGFLGASAEVAVGAADPPSEAELVLHPLERVRGRVISADGEPLPGVWLASCLDSADGVLEYLGSATSGGDGGFELPGEKRPGEEPGHEPVRLFASGPGCPLTDTLVVAPARPPAPPGDGEVRDGDGAPEPEAGSEVVIRCDAEPAVLRVHLAFSASHALAGETLLLRRSKDRVIPGPVLEGHLRSLGLPPVTNRDGELLLVLAPGTWEIYRAGEASPASIGTGSHRGRLGGAALDPRTVTDLYTGAGDR